MQEMNVFTLANLSASVKIYVDFFLLLQGICTTLNLIVNISYSDVAIILSVPQMKGTLLPYFTIT